MLHYLWRRYKYYRNNPYPWSIVIQTLWRRFIKEREGRLVIVFRLSAMGDVLCTIPMIYSLMEDKKNKRVTLVTRHELTPLLKYVYPPIDYCGVHWSSITPKLSNVQNVDIHNPLTSEERGLGGVQIHLATDLAASCKIDVQHTHPKIVLPKKVILERLSGSKSYKNSRKQLRITLATGRTWPVREYPKNSWQELVDLIHSNYSAHIYQVCGSRGEQMATDMALRDVDLIFDKPNIIDVAAVIADSDVVIGIDGGPLHLAISLERPVLGLFGAISPRLRLNNSPYTKGITSKLACSPCHHQKTSLHWQVSCPFDIQCMTSLSPEDVLMELRKLIKIIPIKELN